MMIAYVRLFQPRAVKVQVSDLVNKLKFAGWGNPRQGEAYSPLNVLNHPADFESECSRLISANLDDPIIVDGKRILDGVHRLSKAYLRRRQTVLAYQFDSVLLRRFLLNADGDWKSVAAIPLHEFITLFFARFCSAPESQSARHLY